MSSNGIAGNAHTFPLANQADHLTPQKTNPQPAESKAPPEAPRSPDRIVVDSPSQRLGSILQTGINRPPRQ